MKKAEIRQKYLLKRQQLNAEEVLKQTLKITQNLKKMPQFKAAKHVVGFYPVHNEPNLVDLYHDLAKEDNHLLFLRIEGKKLIPHKVDHLDHLEAMPPYDIPQPPKHAEKVKIEHLDMILVPGIVFDHEGHRIGFGGGYYDRFLKNVDAIKVGISFDFQLVDKLPREEHDIALDALVTPSKTYIF